MRRLLYILVEVEVDVCTVYVWQLFLVLGIRDGTGYQIIRLNF